MNRLQSETPANQIRDQSNQQLLRFSCPYCGRELRTTRGLNLHIKLRHTPYLSVKNLMVKHKKCVEKDKYDKLMRKAVCRDASTSKYFCYECKQGFSRAAVYKHHLQKHITLTNTEARCHECGKICKSKHGLKVHYYYLHTEARRNLICPARLCNKRFGSVTERSRHFADHRKSYSGSDSGRYICGLEECSKTFDRFNQFLRHQQEHPVRNKCMFCEYQNAEEFNVYEHERTHADKFRFKCTSCDLSFTSNENRIQHEINVHHREKGISFNCPLCDEKFAEEREYQQHVKTQHFRCPYCDHRCLNEHSLKNHLHFKHNGSHACTLDGCTRRFTTIHGLHMHWREEHAYFLCHLCKIQFESLEQIKEHDVQEHKKEKLECAYDGCKEWFTNKLKLRVHMKSAHGFRWKRVSTKYTCIIPKCGKIFIDETSYRRHLEHTHNWYLCITHGCLLMFRTKQEREKHKSDMHASRRSPCEYCTTGRSQRSKFQLHQHTKMVHNMYHCGFCNLVFRSDDDLQRHTLRVHYKLS